MIFGDGRPLHRSRRQPGGCEELEDRGDARHHRYEAEVVRPQQSRQDNQKADAKAGHRALSAQFGKAAAKHLSFDILHADLRIGA